MTITEFTVYDKLIIETQTKGDKLSIESQMKGHKLSIHIELDERSEIEYI